MYMLSPCYYFTKMLKYTAIWHKYYNFELRECFKVFNSMLDDNLESLKIILDNYSGSAHIKNVSDGKYVYSNRANVKKFGLIKPEEIYGLTIKDLDVRMHEKWGSVGDIAVELEKVVVTECRQVIDTGRAFLTANGHVYMHEMIKIPLLSKGEVSRIVTLSNNIADNLNLIDLYELYRKFYSANPRQGLAIKKFLEHIGIDKFFTTLPTDAEIRVLIARKSSGTQKELAYIVSSSQKTVETHLCNLRKKIHGSDIYGLVLNIRNKTGRALYE